MLDLGREYRIEGIRLLQTHNATLNDRSTNGYAIYGGTVIEPINRPDETTAGGMDLADPALLAAGDLQRQTFERDPIEGQWVDLPWQTPCARYLRFETVGPLHDAQQGVGLNEIRVFMAALQAGDADRDFDADHLDVVQVLQRGKYLSGEPATWGEGDWDGAPGGEPGNPPPGNGVFDQIDIINSLNGVAYHGPYAAPQCGGEARFTGIVPQPIAPGGILGDAQTSVVYDPETGEIAVDAPAEVQLTSLNLDSVSSRFVSASWNVTVFGGSFDIVAANRLFKATFDSSFGSISLGHVAQPGLAQEFFLNDLTVAGSLAGGGHLGPVDLVYMQELYPGDANRDFTFGQLDIVRVLQAGKYLTGQRATWGEGDWNGAPGGYPGNPPRGNGLFDQLDIIAALPPSSRLAGPYAAVGTPANAVGTVPEPASVGLLILGLVSLTLHWSKRRKEPFYGPHTK